MVQEYSLQIQTLSYSQSVHAVTAAAGGPDGAVPEGCAVAIASDRCTVHLLLKVRAAGGGGVGETPGGVI